jgi:hypothetical protein
VKVGSSVKEKAGSHAKYQTTNEKEWTIVGDEVE